MTASHSNNNNSTVQITRSTREIKVHTNPNWRGINAFFLKSLFKQTRNFLFPFTWKTKISQLRLKSCENSQAPSTLYRTKLKTQLIRHKNGAFRKRSSNQRSLKTSACVSVWTENILKTKLFGKRWHRNNIVYGTFWKGSFSKKMTSR